MSVWTQETTKVQPVLTIKQAQKHWDNVQHQLRHRSLFHRCLFPFTHRSTEHAKIPNNAVEKTYREGPGCMQKAQVWQYVTRQSSRSCRSRTRAESTKHENWKGKCVKSGLSHIARRGTRRWKENPPAGGNRGKPGGKRMWSMLDDACRVWLEGCPLTLSLPPSLRKRCWWKTCCRENEVSGQSK